MCPSRIEKCSLNNSTDMHENTPKGESKRGIPLHFNFVFMSL